MANRTPLYEWHVAHGARIVDFAGWEMPIQYSGIIEEHTSVRGSAGLFDISHMGRLVFQGPEADVLAFLQLLFTNDAATMSRGQIRYGLLCNEQGGILDDVLVYRLETLWMMVVNASNRDKILAWMAQHAGRFPQVRVVDCTARWAMLAVQGPRAPQLVATWAEKDPAVENISYYHGKLLQCTEDLGKVVSRTGYTGEDGFELIVSNDSVVQVADRLFEIAGKLGVSLRPAGLGARDTLRLEAGMPLYGHEMNEEIDPFQAGLAWAVKLNKGDFLGRAALQRRRQDASLRKRVGLELDGRRIAREGAAVLVDGREVGRVSSGTFGPTLQKVIAMAYMDQDVAKPGTVCAVDVRGKAEGARVVPLPFYQRSKS